MVDFYFASFAGQPSKITCLFLCLTGDPALFSPFLFLELVAVSELTILALIVPPGILPAAPAADLPTLLPVPPPPSA